MDYNYYFEIAAILILGLILIDYLSKMKIYTLESRLFEIMLYSGIVEDIINLISCILIERHEEFSLNVNISFCLLFFILQSFQIFITTIFIFSYLNTSFSFNSPAFYITLLSFIVNLGISILSPVYKLYFYFDSNGVYHQGSMANFGYLFYFIATLIAVFYAFFHHGKFYLKRVGISAVVALFVVTGVVIQYFNRQLLAIDVSMVLAILYLYFNAENPNDYIDRITNCANEYAFKNIIDSKCSSEKPFSVIMVDIKHFRNVNIFYGNKNGDFILNTVGNRLNAVFPSDMTFRIFGDIFYIVLNDYYNNPEVLLIKLSEKLQELILLPDGRSAQITPLIYVCDFPTYFKSHTDLSRLQRTMRAMLKEDDEVTIYNAPKKYLDQCIRFENVENALSKALTKKTLNVVYQPIVDSQTNKAISLEALCRLNDDELGVIPPDEFIDVAEKNGKIIPLGFYVLEDACKFIKYELLSNPDICIDNIHINISALQFAYPGIVNKTLSIIDMYEVPHSMIQFEFTERVMIESPSAVKAIMDDFVKEGINFALDDYGTGCSNISYLIQFPFTKIKFEKNLIQSFFSCKDAKTILKNEFNTLKLLNKVLVAEGIETREQVDELSAFGINIIQGFYYSKPLSKDDCIKFLCSKKEL